MRRGSKFVPKNLDNGKRLVVFLLLVAQTLLLAVALWPTCWLLLEWGPHVQTAHGWVLLILGAIFAFNYAYLFGLLAIRLVLPYPKEGFYPRGKDGRLPKEAITFMFNVILMRMRLQTPWAWMFTSAISNLPPMATIYQRLMGPRTPSVNMGDVAFIIDPYLVKAGTNVQFGFSSIVACHTFDQRGLWIKGVTIGDDVIIGGNAIISPGVEIGDHSIVAARSFVAPNTVIGPYEYWAGSPAEKVKDMRRPLGDAAKATAEPTAVAAPPVAEDDVIPQI